MASGRAACQHSRGTSLGGRGMRQLTLILGITLAVVAIGSGWIGWIDEGEVVQLTTYDARAHGHEKIGRAHV